MAHHAYPIGAAPVRVIDACSYARWTDESNRTNMLLRVIALACLDLRIGDDANARADALAAANELLLRAIELLGINKGEITDE